MFGRWLEQGASKLKSDMQGTKAQALDAWAQQHGRALTRFDYSGHGESGGAFEAGTISRWLVKAGDEVHSGDVLAEIERVQRRASGS